MMCKSSLSRKTVFLLILLIALIAAGCTPSVFHKPIKDFSASVSESGQLLEAYLENNRLAVIDATVEKIAQERRRLTYTQEDGSVSVIGADRYDLDPNTGHNAIQLMDQIVTYAESLQNIIEADTREQLENDVQALTSSIQTLPGKSSGEASGQIGKALQNAAGMLIDHKKHNVVKTAVAEANPVIKESGDLLKEMVRRAKKNAVLIQRKNLDRLIRQYNEVKTSDTNNELLLKKISADIRDLKKEMAFDPGQIIDQMVSAHQALKDASEEKITQSELLNEINKFQMSLLRARN